MANSTSTGSSRVISPLIPVSVRFIARTKSFDAVQHNLKFELLISTLRLGQIDYYAAWMFWVSLRCIGMVPRVLFFDWWHIIVVRFGCCGSYRRCGICRGIMNIVCGWCRYFRRPVVHILYHSKCYGRINLTDVNDSLYDGYLKYLSERFGSSRILMIIDDLDNPELTKQTVEKNQPTAVKCCEKIYYLKKEEEEDKKGSESEQEKKTYSHTWNKEQIQDMFQYVKSKDY
ncbi:uncharacterized protein LOC122798641 [Protopterus annectens]|uniref:uncharacterized protein LOC122798641 n=1 Tax=Protopterus annectens TaxID=7888 RepID=UPI001CFBBEA9|nr:uncharacterized protein LOC122798641 [Protopterus annectens]